ncbi:hypothetical protein OfM1_05350 [Lactovum odontotermitis]
MKPVKVEKNHPILFVAMLAGIGLLVGGIILFFIMVVMPDSEKKNQISSSSSSSSKPVLSSTEAQATTSSSVTMSWSSLELNQQISILIQCAASQAALAGQNDTMLGASTYSMTGTVSDGTLLMNNGTENGSEELADVTITDGYVTVENKFMGTTGTFLLKKLIETYFSTQDEQDSTNAMSQRIVAPIDTLGSAMNLDEILAGNYKSIQGIWSNSVGNLIVISGNDIMVGNENNEPLISGINFQKSDGSGTMNYKVTNGYIAGYNNGASQGAVSKGGAPFTLDFIPKDISFKYGQTETERERDRIFLGSSAIGPVEVVLANSLYYRSE